MIYYISILVYMAHYFLNVCIGIHCRDASSLLARSIDYWQKKKKLQTTSLYTNLQIYCVSMRETLKFLGQEVWYLKLTFNNSKRTSFP